MRSRILAIFFVLWVWPGTGEAAEYVTHWLQDGDAVHGRSHRAPIQGDDDGCPGPAHLCHLASCAAWSTTAPTRIETPSLVPAAALVAAPPAPVACVGCEDPAPELRPPIA